MIIYHTAGRTVAMVLCSVLLQSDENAEQIMNLIDCPLHHIDILYFFPLFSSYFLARLNSKVYISTVTGMTVIPNKIHLIKMNVYKIICFEKYL